MLVDHVRVEHGHRRKRIGLRDVSAPEVRATDPGAAHRALADGYGFTDAQARALTDVQSGRLTSSEVDDIERRPRQLSRRIDVLEQELGEA